MLCDYFGKDENYQENHLVNHYTKLGHTVVVVASLYTNAKDYYSNKKIENKQNTKELRDSNFTLYRNKYSINILNRIRKLSGVSEILNQEKPDLIYCHSVHFNLNDAADYIKKNKPVKIILDFHGDYSNSGKNFISLKILNGFIRKRYLQKYAKYVSKFYAVVPEAKKFMTEIFGIPPHKIELLPLGVDLGKIRSLATEENRTFYREKHFIKDDDIVIVSAGKINRIKKTDQLLKAINHINHPKIHVFLGGVIDGEDISFKQEMDDLIKENEHIHFLGWLGNDEIIKYLNASDIAIFPASQSVLWQQAIGVGCATILGRYSQNNGTVIAQDVDYLNQDENLIILESTIDKTNELQEKIFELVQEPNKINLLKQKNKMIAENFLNYEEIAKKTLNL